MTFDISDAGTHEPSLVLVVKVELVVDLVVVELVVALVIVLVVLLVVLVELGEQVV